MGKAENGEIREVTANIWEDRKHHLWFPISFTKYTCLLYTSPSPRDS